SGALELVAIAKQAVLAAAAAVNDRLEAKQSDVWCAVLPSFHVGGLGIYARAHLTGSRVVPTPWSPRSLVESDATLVSLVPAQVHDLLESGLTPRPPLRALLLVVATFLPALL